MMTKHNMLTHYAVVKKNATYDDKTLHANTACCGKRTLFIMTKHSMLTQHAVVKKNAISYDKTQ